MDIERLKKIHYGVSQAELDLIFISTRNEKIAEAAHEARLAMQQAAERIRDLLCAYATEGTLSDLQQDILQKNKN